MNYYLQSTYSSAWHIAISELWLLAIIISFIIVANFTSLLNMLETYYLPLTSTKFLTSMFYI